MDEKKAPGYYGRLVGVVSGLFSILQVLIASAALNGSYAAVTSYYVGGYPDGILRITDMGPLILSTLLSAILLGCVTLIFAWYAGRLSAIAVGARKGGASAGLSVWWVSSLIWIVFSLVGAAINTRNLIDALTSGTLVIASQGAQYDTHFFPLGFFSLLVIDVLGALVCLGLCAAAGAIGASTAPLNRLGFQAMTGSSLRPGAPALAGYAMAPAPPMGYPGYPGYPVSGAPGGYQPYPPAPGVYPPPPTYYAQQPRPQQPSMNAAPAPSAITPTDGASASVSTPSTEGDRPQQPGQQSEQQP